MKYITILLSTFFLSFGFLKKDDYSNYHIEAKKYCIKSNLNTDFYILIDLGIHSGQKRFFVYNFKEKKVTASYMVSHGCGNSAWSATSTKEDAAISNEPDSHASSIGKYVIASRGVSQWGIKVNYTLIGKDKTNSNAEKRAIVLHSWDYIPQQEVYPEGTPEGWGCPAINNDDMKELDKKLQSAKKRKLMWIIKSTSKN